MAFSIHLNGIKVDQTSLYMVILIIGEDRKWKRLRSRGHGYAHFLIRHSLITWLLIIWNQKNMNFVFELMGNGGLHRIIYKVKP
mgnify:CR=1 FL=1